MKINVFLFPTLSRKCGIQPITYYSFFRLSAYFFFVRVWWRRGCVHADSLINPYNDIITSIMKRNKRKHFISIWKEVVIFLSQVLLGPKDAGAVKFNSTISGRCRFVILPTSKHNSNGFLLFNRFVRCTSSTGESGGVESIWPIVKINIKMVLENRCLFQSILQCWSRWYLRR